VAKETLRLLEAWRAAERAAGAARLAAEHAQEAADAAELSAEAAKRAAEDAGVTLEAADLAAGGAKKAYHNHEAEIIEAEDKERGPRACPVASGSLARGAPRLPLLVDLRPLCLWPGARARGRTVGRGR
jgi:hypothetical protein